MNKDVFVDEGIPNEEQPTSMAFIAMRTREGLPNAEGHRTHLLRSEIISSRAQVLFIGNHDLK